MAKARGKAVACARRILNKGIVKDFVQEFLPKDRHLELKLQEVCANCPLHDGTGNHRDLSPSAREDLGRCRMRYFGILLQSFLGSPGDEETEWLFSYLRKCEECLLSVPISHSRLREVGTGRGEISAGRGQQTSNS
jgi:hypothetical protein